MLVKIYGFTLLRNGLKYDYPFRESLRSLCDLCDEVVVALGNSDDGTAEALGEFKNLVIVPTVWDENLRQSGLILSQQTNVALAKLRERHPRGWAMYLQADEVLCEADFPRIRADIQRAEAEGCDAVSFRYLHFWQSYHRIAVDWRWYPQEIRALRLDAPGESYGDAQSFRPVAKRFESDAPVYHYGHVREPVAYARKKADFNRWWHGDEEMKKVLAKGARRDRHERTHVYLGRHPSSMQPRIAAEPVPAVSRQFLVFGRPDDFPGLLDHIAAPVQWTESVRDVLAYDPKLVVALRPLPWWAKLLRWPRLGSGVRTKMASPQAREWPADFQAMMKFSEKGIPVR